MKVEGMERGKFNAPHRLRMICHYQDEISCTWKT